MAIKIRSGDFLRTYWLPKSKEPVMTCFEKLVEATKYYLAKMGMPLDTPVFLATEWPDPPEGRWNYAVTAMLTEAFNKFHAKLNLVTYVNASFDIGPVFRMEQDYGVERASAKHAFEHQKKFPQQERKDIFLRADFRRKDANQTCKFLLFFLIPLLPLVPLVLPLAVFLEKLFWNQGSVAVCRAALQGCGGLLKVARSCRVLEGC